MAISSGVNGGASAATCAVARGVTARNQTSLFHTDHASRLKSRRDRSMSRALDLVQPRNKSVPRKEMQRRRAVGVLRVKSDLNRSIVPTHRPTASEPWDTLTIRVRGSNVRTGL